MSAQGLEVIDSTVQKTHRWIHQVAEVTHLSEAEAFKSLRAVLHTLRDRLPVDVAAGFASELPMLIRGMFFEGWRPAEVPKKFSREEFLERVREQIITERVIDPVRITSEVLSVISSEVGAPEAEKIRQILPKDIQALWPQAVES
jgi:uncharacterized protein (DUF2267 family)